MAAPALDVWYVSAEQVYRGVPFQVAAGWVEQGRLAAADKVRPARTNDPWVTVAAHPLLADYLPLKAVEVAKPAALTANVEPVEDPDPPAHRKDEPDDDDVDIIPLIDVSLVLLVFFIITAQTGMTGGVKLAEASRGAEIRSDDPAVVTVEIDLRESGEAFYALRVGIGRTIKPEDNNLVTLPEVLARLDALLPQFTSPPEVRIACHQKVKQVRVRELVTKIDPYRRSGKISGYTAEVNEKPK